MLLEIITPDVKVFEGEVSSATFPGSKGTFQVLKDHAPIISSLEKGILKYVDQDGEHQMTIDGGIVEVLKNRIIVLSEEVSDKR